MDLGAFLLMFVIVLIILYYIFIFKPEKKKFAKRFFWGFGIASVAYSVFFNGIIDRVFVLVFSIFLVVAKVLMSLFDT